MTSTCKQPSNLLEFTGRERSVPAWGKDVMSHFNGPSKVFLLKSVSRSGPSEKKQGILVVSLFIFNNVELVYLWLWRRNRDIFKSFLWNFSFFLRLCYTGSPIQLMGVYTSALHACNGTVLIAPIVWVSVWVGSGDVTSRKALTGSHIFSCFCCGQSPNFSVSVDWRQQNLAQSNKS